MLSRLASHLYLIGRGLERAEYLARCLRVHRELWLDHAAPDDVAFWSAFLDLVYLTASTAVGCEEAIELSVRGPGRSISEAVEAARRSAQAVRPSLPLEFYEQLNAIHWRIEAGGWRGELYGWLRGVELGVQLLTGLVEDGMLRGEARDFVRLGRYLERAAAVTRLVTWKSRSLTELRRDSLEWAAVLRCCNSFEAYRLRTLVPIQRDQAVSFLLLDRASPHSVGFCINEALGSVRRIDGGDAPLPRTSSAGGEGPRTSAHRALGHLAAAFEFADPLQVAAAPLDFGAHVEALTSGLEAALGTTYFRPSRMAAAMTGGDLRSSPLQQQQISSP